MNYQAYIDIKQQYKKEENKRLFVELDYCLEINRIENSRYDALLDQAFFILKKEVEKKKTISAKVVRKIESVLIPMQERIKKDTVLCIAHAHIDINWLWGYDETVSVTIATIETMLHLMDQYKQFTYGQSQGFVYDIIAQYRPDLLKKIRKYVHEGRFEVTAATYVEADKNLSNAETQLTQLLYNKRHLANLLEIPISNLDLDFEPDTFGHSAYVPEILSLGGVKYYYHCRGNENPPFYRFTAPSGKSVLVYREPKWYMSSIDDDAFRDTADFCHRYQIHKMLKIYGVGDHGGGASVRDIERIIEMQNYPLLPTIRFGTYHEFFHHIEEQRKDLPVYQAEQNQIFTGCYSTNSRIKTAHAKAQEMLYDTKVLASLAQMPISLEEAEKIICVNEFHDILPGSGVQETSDYSLGKYQEAFAILGQTKEQVLKKIEKDINTKFLFRQGQSEKNEIARGAGVGFHNKNITHLTHFAYGKERVFIVFNSLNMERKSMISIPLWDYFGNVHCMKVFDDQDQELPFVIQNSQSHFYWYHHYFEILVEVDLPPLGYRCVILREQESDLPVISYPPLFQRIEEEGRPIILENDYIKATFHEQNFVLTSLFLKETQRELLSAPAEFQFVLEDTTEQMTSWYVGRYKKVSSLHEHLRFVPNSYQKNILQECFSVEGEYQSSTFRMTIVLWKDRKQLDYQLDCQFFEKGSTSYGVPQMRFVVPVADSFSSVQCDVPLGTITRLCKNQDVCCSSFIASPTLALIASTKHGFRAYQNRLGVTLLRGSYDPHPYPDYGHHVIDFSLSTETNLTQLKKISLDLSHPACVISATPHAGNRETHASLLSLPQEVDLISLSYQKDGLYATLFNDDFAAKDLSFSDFKHCFIYPNAFEAEEKIDKKIHLSAKSLCMIRLVK